MAIAILGLALWLIALAKWGRSLQAKNATLRRKRIYGVVLATPMLLMPLLFGGGAFLFVWCAACAVLGYVTVVHAPRWIVGSR